MNSYYQQNPFVERRSANPNLGTRILFYALGEFADAGGNIKNFEVQMKWLADQGYSTISLGDLVNNPLQDNKKILITFDEAYRPDFLRASEVLDKYGFKATVFCTALKVNQPDSLTVKEIHTFHNAGYEFGSRSMNGVRLRGMGRDDKWKEIFGSKHYLEDMLGFKVNFFCYPWGDYDEEAVRLTRQAGYDAACSNMAGLNRRLNKYLLRRTEVLFADSEELFRKKIAGAYDLFYLGLQWVKGMAA